MNPHYRIASIACLAAFGLTATSAITAQDGADGAQSEAATDPSLPDGYEDTGNDSVDVETGGDSVPDFYAIVDSDGEAAWTEADVAGYSSDPVIGQSGINAEFVPEDFQDSLPFIDRKPNAEPPPAADSETGPDERSVPTRRVSLGFKVLENQAKFQAQISYTPDPVTWAPTLSGVPQWARKHICGGALIAREWVLTAAHCINAKKLERGLTVTLGAEDISKAGDGMQFKVDRIVIHRRYSMFQNDIALLHLAPDTRMRNPSEIGPIELYSGPEPAKDTPVSGMGWGQTSEAAAGAKPSAILWRADQKLIPAADCSRLPGFGPNPKGVPRINNRVLCAGNSRSKTCSGDSGGPLVMTDGPRLLVGIVAWNKADCNNPANPGVYTRVSAFTGWIRKGMATTAAGGRVQFLDD